MTKNQINRITGLDTKEVFLTRLNQMLTLSQDEIEKRVLIYCNIRNFSYYNIQNGRNAGDDVLRYFASLILKLNPRQLCAHYDSDHFAFVALQENVNELLVQILGAFSKKYQNSGLKVKLGIYNLRKGVNAKQSSKQAKFACDSIRDAQVDYCYFNEKLSKRTAAEAYVLSHIDKALEDELIHVYYQPVIRTITGHLCGLEALTRWIDPQKGLISPVEFIPVLEKNHLITKLDLYMLDHVCQMLSERLTNNQRVVPISINLSRDDFVNCDIFQEVESCVQKYHLARDFLNIEVTESIVMEDPGTLKKEMQRFRQAGYEIWMDDFGSGYSSLNVLRDFVFDEIKLDMLFMRNFDERSKQMIRSIVSMAKELDLQTLAEGVETKEQYDFLRNIGCEKVQGYYYSPPVPIDKIQEMYDQNENVETRLDRTIYRSVGKLNFMDSRSLAIEDYYDDAFHLLFRNQKYHDVWEQIGIIGREKRHDLINSHSSPYYTEFRKPLKKLTVTDDFMHYDFEIYGDMVNLDVRLLAKQDDHYLLALQVSGITKRDQKEEHTQSYVNEVLPTIYDGIYVINLKNCSIKTVKPSVNHALLAKTWAENGMIDGKKIAKIAILNEDQAEFIKFSDPKTIKLRLALEERDYLTQMFRTRMGNGSYVWKLHTFQIVPGSDLAIYSTLDVPFLEEQLIKKNQELPMDRDHIFAKEIWNVMLHTPSFNVFWKDMDRRFVGVNDSFLKYYGIEDVRDVIGKTDEDMGWNIDEGSFRDDEYQVLHDGIPIVNEVGKSIILGRVHNILVNKSPVYHNGKRIGLVGTFTSLDDLTSYLGGRGINDKQDPISRLMSAQAISNVASDLIEGWSYRKEKFAVIAMEFDSYRRAANTYNQTIARKMLRELGHMISQVCGNRASAGRIYGEYFLILMRYETKKSVRSVYNRLLDACDHTHELAGYPATINPDVKIYYAEETKDVRMMMKEATRGFDIGFGTSKNFEEHLRENNIDFDEFVRRIPGGVALFSVNPLIYPVYVSDTLAHMLGYSTKEYLALINKDNSFGAVGEDIVLLKNKVKDAVEHGKKYNIVYRMKKKDGETLWIREQGSMISSRNGHPLLLSVFQNLSDTENVFGYVMDETQEGLIIRENETHAILYYNNAVSKLLKSVGPSASIESLSATLYDDHQEGNVYKLLYASHYLIIRLLKTEWFGRQAEMCYIIDCTSQHNRFMYLQEILSHVPAGIALYEVNQNHEVKCTYLSEQARTHCHIAYERMNSLEDLMSIVHPDDREEATQKIYDAVVKRHPLDIELRVIGIDESIYWDRLELEPCVQENGRYYMYGVFTDVTELHHRGEQLEALSQSDELTGLRNRHALRYDFDLFVHRDIAVMMLDIDHFKAFNDHYGHDVGDMVMKICGQAIREEFRNCYAYRYGGDEILIVSLMDNYTQMEERFDTMMQTLEEMCAKQSVPSVIFSYGIACGFADNPEDVRDYFKRADRLMYINKTEHHTLEEDDA